MIEGKKVIVVLPSYNASKTLEQTYNEIPLNIVDDIILVDDKSNDNTLDIANKLNIKNIILHNKNTGYGGSQKTCYNKALELGADIIFPLKCKNQQKLDLNFNRIMKIAQQATAQSGRLILPKISKPIDFRKALDFVGNLNSSINILFSLNEESKDFNSVISGLNKYKNINLFIGPEGDFSQSEVNLAKQKGFLLCKLSMNILRTETAGIFLTGLLSFLFKR